MRLPIRPVSALRSVIYRNDGGGVFTQELNTGLTQRTDDAAAACFADHDNDVDLFRPGWVSRAGYRNNGDGTFTKIMGGLETALVAQPDWLFPSCAWRVSGGDSSGNQQSLNAEFGLADAEVADTLRIEWPSGIVQEPRWCARDSS